MADRIQSAIEQVYADGAALTRDVGGTAGTRGLRRRRARSPRVGHGAAARAERGGDKGEPMHYHHLLPLWFLVLSLFLPRVALFLAWLEHWHVPVSPLVAYGGLARASAAAGTFSYLLEPRRLAVVPAAPSGCPGVCLATAAIVRSTGIADRRLAGLLGPLAWCARERTGRTSAAAGAALSTA